jgi:hypothetical protein
LYGWCLYLVFVLAARCNIHTVTYHRNPIHRNHHGFSRSLLNFNKIYV